ncbi:hypothetical protein N7492_005084 [Penicillium capsulatum]|uniref:Ribosomal protein S13 n=1 Tax=Penicillium capsulatum TaxID=69766 RepID=A0A9W9I958_9EURO|nr:hypothetical protein N7492_005084 [Penicillium capsulatum]
MGLTAFRRNIVAGRFLPRIAASWKQVKIPIQLTRQPRQDGISSRGMPLEIGLDTDFDQVFILGVNFPERNLLKKSLQSFFGIGNNTSSRLLARFNIHPTCRVGELANKQVLDLTAVLSDMKIENDLRREVLNDIKRLKETGTYRGRRHALGLPVRGQRTRTQIKTPVKLNRMERRV